ncbi:MAG: F0F1 ATP synthase subunit delta [Candidatus Dormibacterales bacterium]
MASASARRYANAVFELAAEEKSERAWAQRLATLEAVLMEPRVRAVVENPSIPPVRRLEAVEAVVPESAGPEAMNLARLLVAARKSAIAGEIRSEFDRLADEAAGRVRATATTAVALNPEERRRLTERLAQRLGREVRLEVQVDPTILGGLVLRVGDRLADASVATRLKQLRRRLAAG